MLPVMLPVTEIRMAHPSGKKKRNDEKVVCCVRALVRERERGR